MLTMESNTDHQAFVVVPNVSNRAKWMKKMHGEVCKSPEGVMEDLIERVEREIAKRLSKNGFIVPFRDGMEEVLEFRIPADR